MTADIDLLPSSFDRLDPVAHAVRWWTSSMASLVPARHPKQVTAQELEAAKARLPDRVTIVLDESDAFVAEAQLPPGSPSSHREAMKLKLAELCPLNPSDLDLTAIAIAPQPVRAVYLVAMARRSRLAELEALARRRGGRDVDFTAVGFDAVAIRSARRLRETRRSLITDAALACLAAVTVAAAANAWAGRLHDETAALSTRERALRQAAVMAEGARRDAELAANFVSKGVLSRRPGAALDALALASAATPNTAWWTGVTWTPDEVVLRGESSDASAAVSALAESALGWSVELSGAIRTGAPGAPQAFEVRMKRKEASK